VIRCMKKNMLIYIFSFIIVIANGGPVWGMSKEMQMDEVILITGGYATTTTRDLATVEVLGAASCSLPSLPVGSACHNAFYTQDGLVLSCGGSAGPTCVALSQDNGAHLQKNSNDGRSVNTAKGVAEWQYHSQLDYNRYYATGQSLPGGTFILGGTTSGSGNSSTFLPIGSTQWEMGPDLPVRMFDGCSAQISDHQLLIIGAYYSRQQVSELDLLSLSWISWPPLTKGRVGHSCATVGDDVIIAGGYGEDRSTLATTTIINIITRQEREGGSMSSARGYFGLATLDGTLLAFGGRGSDDQALASVEEWDVEMAVWKTRQEVLETARYYFGYTSAPRATVCPSF